MPDPAEHLVGDRFPFGALASGRTIKLNNVIGELTRQCVAIKVDQPIDVVQILDRIPLSDDITEAQREYQTMDFEVGTADSLPVGGRLDLVALSFCRHRRFGLEGGVITT